MNYLQIQKKKEKATEIEYLIANPVQNWGVFSSKPKGHFLVHVRQPHKQKTMLDGAVPLES
jgi:hypothetical protein